MLGTIQCACCLSHHLDHHGEVQNCSLPPLHLHTQPACVRPLALLNNATLWPRTVSLINSAGLAAAGAVEA